MKPMVFLMFLTLAACETPVEEAPETVEDVVDENEMCAASDYRDLIGSSVAETTLPVGSMLRVYGAGDIITQEYLPRRTNIVFNADGIISRVYCG